jgi:hypothetical protein
MRIAIIGAGFGGCALSGEDSAAGGTPYHDRTTMTKVAWSSRTGAVAIIIWYCGVRRDAAAG